MGYLTQHRHGDIVESTSQRCRSAPLRCRSPCSAQLKGRFGPCSLAAKYSSVKSVGYLGIFPTAEPDLKGSIRIPPCIDRPTCHQVFDGYVGVILSVHFAKVGSTKGASPIASRMRAARAIISDVEAKFGRSMVFGKSAILPVPGEKRVVPTIS